MIRVPVLSPDGKPLMPAKASRVRRWLGNGKAKVIHNDLGKLLQRNTGLVSTVGLSNLTAEKRCGLTS